MKMVHCSFCNLTINGITRKDIENNWGIASGKIDGKTILLVHCPSHKDKYSLMLKELFSDAYNVRMQYKQKDMLQERLTLSDIPRLLLWRKLICALIGHKLQYENNVEYCTRCGMARASIVVLGGKG